MGNASIFRGKSLIVHIATFKITLSCFPPGGRGANLRFKERKAPLGVARAGGGTEGVALRGGRGVQLRAG